MKQSTWAQAVIEFADRQTGERVAVEHLRPALVTALADQVIATWWFIRKTPYWRLRYQPMSSKSHAAKHLAHTLDELTTHGRIVGWTAGNYEPEVHAFGGATGMDVAHELFHHDSRNILDHLYRLDQPHRQATDPAVASRISALGRRELALLLFSVLLRAAGQDWYEQGDVWAKVADLRPAEPTTYLTAPEAERLRPAMRRLMTVDANPTSSLMDGGPLAALADWSAAFEYAGQQLAELARYGVLQRGLRAVLAHHVIFHWNRLGLPRADQTILSALAKEVVMGAKDNTTSDNAASAPQTSTGPISVGDVDTEITKLSDKSITDPGPDTATGADAGENAVVTPESLRSALVDKLREQGTIRTESVEAALRTVPRHLFVPDVSLATAYADDAVYTKKDGAGTSISAASQPTIVAMMLEQLQVEPGHYVLELGAGTGYNAGLLGYLVGDYGRVITIDVDQDLVAGARTGLAAAGAKGNVRAILGDGALGYAAGGPYDRIIATVGAWGLPAPWLEQLAPGGRLVVPLRIRGSVSRSIVFERSKDSDGEPRCWRSIASDLCTFMPLRGVADDARRIVSLTPDGAVTLQTHQEQTVDAATLMGVLHRPRSIEAWTEVAFRGSESMEWMELWLTCAMDNALCRMPVERSAVDSGLVKPQFGWGSVAVTEKADLAYLTVRPAEPAADGGQLYEIGVIGHGPNSSHLGSRVVDAIRTWNRDYRSRPVQFKVQLHHLQRATPAEPAGAAAGRYCFDTPLHRLTITWQ